MTTDRLAALLAMLEQDPKDSFCLYGVAQEHVKRGNPEEAIAWFDRTIESDPDHAYAWFHKARAQDALGRRDAAMASLRSGSVAARRSGDAKAMSEIDGWLEELEGS